MRPIRRLSALIRVDQDGYICSSGFAVVTPVGGVIESEVVLTYLRLPIICEILNLYTTASMYPAVPTDRLMGVPLVVPDARTRKAVVASVRTSITARWEATELLARAKAAIEDAIRRGR